MAIAVDLAASDEQLVHGLYGWLLPTPPFPSQPWRRDFFADADRPERLLRPHHAHPRHSRTGGAARGAARAVEGASAAAPRVDPGGARRLRIRARQDCDARAPAAARHRRSVLRVAEA